jgi:phospholipase D1/2
MAYNRRDDDLAYGDYHGEGGAEGDRGLIGDMGRRLFGGKKEVRQPSTKRHPVIVLPAHIAFGQAG